MKTFFDTVLPSQGLRCIALAKPQGKWHHHWYDDNAAMAADAAKFDAAGESVYFAVNSFADTGGRPRSRRKHELALACRTFIVDLDVFDPRDPEPAKRPEYPNQKAAARAILEFALRVGLPRPWLVSSGVGLHAYWPMDADMSPALWEAIAKALKRALTAAGVLYDPSRTGDLSSVLRPPGTTHRKFDPLPVKLRVQGDIGTVQAFAVAMVPWMEDEPASPAPSSAPLSTANAALGGGMSYEPSSAEQVADNCGVIGLIRSTLGKVDYPTWFHGIGVLAFTDEAPAIVHDWSKGDHRYTAAETDQKIADWQAKSAATCAAIEPYQPDICAACPFKGRVKSPVQLGRGQYAPAPVQQTPPQAAAGGSGRGSFGGGTTTGGPAPSSPAAPSTPAPGALPDGFRTGYENGHKTLERWIPPDGKEPGYWLKFCDTYFVPLKRLLVQDAHFTDWQALDRTEGPRVFRMSTATLNKGGKDTLGELGKYGLTPVPGTDKHMDNYLRRWAIRTQQTPLIIAHDHLGWSHDHFVTGEIAIAPDGSESPTVLGETAEDMANVVVAKGDLATWVAMVDRAYNAPNQEAYQFQLLCSFAAPLLGLLGQVNGITVYAHSAGSGVGKTTVQKVALSVWGFWDDMMLAQKKTTSNALWGLMGVYNSLPVVYDELTNADKDEVSDLVYSMTSGRGKKRMTNAGLLRKNNSNWKTILLASGNTLLSEKLAGVRGNPEAEMSRLFEFTQPSAMHMDVDEANKLFSQIDHHYGVAGLRYARYLVRNRAKIVQYLAMLQREVVREFEIRPVDRHWSVLFTCVLAARTFCERRGLCQFDEAPLKAWMHARLDENRTATTSAIITTDDQLAMMIGEMMQYVLITSNLGNVRSNAMANVVENGFPRSGQIKGRLIREHGRETQLWLARPHVRTWCRTNGVTYRVLFEEAIRRGWADPSDGHQLKLGSGTIYDVAPIMCLKLFPDRMPGGATQLVVHQGGNVHSLGGARP